MYVYFHIFTSTNICLFIMRYHKTSFTFSMKLPVKGLLTEAIEIARRDMVIGGAALRGIRTWYEATIQRSASYFRLSFYISRKCPIRLSTKIFFQLFNRTCVKMKK